MSYISKSLKSSTITNLHGQWLHISESLPRNLCNQHRKTKSSLFSTMESKYPFTSKKILRLMHQTKDIPMARKENSAICGQVIKGTQFLDSNLKASLFHWFSPIWKIICPKTPSSLGDIRFLYMWHENGIYICKFHTCQFYVKFSHVKHITMFVLGHHSHEQMLNRSELQITYKKKNHSLKISEDLTLNLWPD